MPEYVLDTVALRVMAFADPEGIAVLLASLEHSPLVIPSEVYNEDEDDISLDAEDYALSELARGIRFAKRQTHLQGHGANRFQWWLENSAQLRRHLDEGALVIRQPELEDLAERERLMKQYGIGRGEASCLAMAGQLKTHAVLVSSDSEACDVARRLNIGTLTLVEILERWIDRTQPEQERFEEFLVGMSNARFAIDPDNLDRLRNRLRSG